MFNTTYFVFRGNWDDGNYKGHYCLHPDYFPFMPVKIIEFRTNREYGEMWNVRLYGGNSWNISIDCLEKEFSFDKFILALLEWRLATGKKLTTEQFRAIMSTVQTVKQGELNYE